MNAWIRGNTVFDGVVDFAKTVADPEHPDQLLPVYDSGDHTHQATLERARWRTRFR